MKRLIVAVIALTFCASLGFAQVPEISKKTFVVKTEKLSKHLELDASQIYEVSNINAYFMEKQQEVLRANPKLQAQKKQEAVYGNLKLMKNVLNEEQYRKYVALINVTNNSYLQKGINASPDVYLADTHKY